MHKSGTTLVSQILHHGGIDMGRIDQDVSYDRGNKYEDPESLALNMELIRAPDTEVLYVPAPDPPMATDAQQERMRRFIAERSAKHADWGFKDPRTVLVYPLWERELPEHRIIGVWRAPEEIWPRFAAPGLRLLHQEPKRAWHYVLRWCEHNERLLDVVRRAPERSLLLHYRDFMTGTAGFDRLQRFVGRELPDQRRASLYRGKRRRYPSYEVAKALVRMRTGRDPDPLVRELERASRA
jgi:hypothetical protein